MHIIIPMAGRSSRFRHAGYKLPKYRLPLPNGMSLFEASVSSFAQYFGSDLFTFIVRVEDEVYVRERCYAMGIERFRIHPLVSATRGQAETVYLGTQGLPRLAAEPLVIFNIDTIRHHYSHPRLDPGAAGAVEVFRGEGEDWSFVVPDGDRRVLRTTEKVRVSDLCSTGMYHFARLDMFHELVHKAAMDGRNSWQGGELFVAPLYNRLLEEARRVDYYMIHKDDVTFSGTPGEYESLVRSFGQVDDPKFKLGSWKP